MIFLPVEKVPSTSGLSVSSPYIVYANTLDELVNILNNTEVWNEFATEIDGAIATGSPTIELFRDSYNKKNKTNLSLSGIPRLDNTDTLYFPHKELYSGCTGYVLATVNNVGLAGIWRVSFIGDIYNGGDGGKGYGIRPVVCIPASAKATKDENGKWKFSN